MYFFANREDVHNVRFSMIQLESFITLTQRIRPIISGKPQVDLQSYSYVWFPVTDCNWVSLVFDVDIMSVGVISRMYRM
jgi:hypothetical protein